VLNLGSQSNRADLDDLLRARVSWRFPLSDPWLRKTFHIDAAYNA